MSDKPIDITDRLLHDSANPTRCEYIHEVVGTAANEITRLRAEVVNWKANHDNQVKLKQSILDRPDLQDRAKKVKDIIAERDRLLAALEAIAEHHDIVAHDFAGCEGAENIATYHTDRAKFARDAAKGGQ